MTVLFQPEPEDIENSKLRQFWIALEAETGEQFSNYENLHRFSVEQRDVFWRAWFRRANMISTGDDSVVEGSSQNNGFGARYFPNIKLNFAENLLQHSGEKTALIGLSESREELRWSYTTLRRKTRAYQIALQKLGVSAGDRVAGFVPNTPEAVAAMLATTSLGAVWTSCSPDFGFQSVLDRFGQVAPKVLFAANSYVYNGKRHACTAKIESILDAIPSIQHAFIIPFGDSADLPKKSSSTENLIDDGQALIFVKRGFNDPLYILYSSGTTGRPKCIVHGIGGTLLQHSKELSLHCDLRAEDTIFYFTTCGWMMWNWLVSSLHIGATLILYDGSPVARGISQLWKMAEKEGLTHLGTSPKFLGSCRDKISPKAAVDLSKLRVILSTGAPLLADDFRWVYSEVKKDVMLASISGGTDIVSCFMLGNPCLPVVEGEIQCFGLGMDVIAADDDGKAIYGKKGELVCRSPHPAMPISFWADDDFSRYRKAYFSKGPKRWVHGDFIEVTQSAGTAGGIVVYGRSDATLNPGGVRIGTAEIYRITEAQPEIADSLVIGQPIDGDVRVVLFVCLKAGVQWNEALQKKIKAALREGASPRHVPSLLFQVEQIPYTISGKKVELAVRQILSGETIQNRDALKNPESLDAFSTLYQQGHLR